MLSRRDGERPSLFFGDGRNRSGWTAPYPLLAAAMISLAAAGCPSFGRAEVDNPVSFERCKSLTDQAARLRCFEEMAGSRAPRAKPDTASVSGWRLVRTPNPRGGPDAVSIMHTAEPSRSDIDLAGLMLRCGDSGFDVLIVLLQPFPPRAHPKVKLTTRGTTVELVATVLPPGAALVLPSEATALASGPWQSATELALEVVDNNAAAIHGVVSLRGLAPAVALLRANCPVR
jgi:hypothetical protein